MKLYICAVFAALVPIAAYADNAGDAQQQAPIPLVEKDASSSSIFTFGYGPPTSIGVDLLGLSTTKVAPANSLQPFVFSLPAIFDGSGGQYAGLDISIPWVLGIGKFESYQRYVSDPWLSRVMRARADFGLTNGSANTDAAKQQLSGYAIGISIPLLTGNDPLRVRLPGTKGDNRYFETCFDRQDKQILALRGIADSNATYLKFAASFELALDTFENTKAISFDPVSESIAVPVDISSTGTISYTNFLGQLTRDFPDIAAKLAQGSQGVVPAPVTPSWQQTVVSEVDAWVKAHQNDPDSAARNGARILRMWESLSAKDIKVQPGASPDHALNDLAAYLMGTGAHATSSDTDDPRTIADSQAVGYLADAKIAPTVTAGGANTIDLDRAHVQSVLKSWRDELDKEVVAASKTNAAANQAASQQAGVITALTNCGKGASYLASIQPDLTVGVGYRENGDAGKFANIRYGGESFWLSGRFPLKTWLPDQGDTAKIIDDINSNKVNYVIFGGNVRYDSHAFFLTGDKTTPVIRANQFTAWGGLEGSITWAKLGAQIGYSSVQAVDSVQRNFNQHGIRWLTEVTAKIGDTGVWLGGTYGNATGTTTKLDDKTFLLTLYFSAPNPYGLFGNKVASK